MSRKKIILLIVAIILIIGLVFLFLRLKTKNTGQVVNNPISANVTKLGTGQSLSIDNLTPSGADLVIYIDRKTGFLKSFKPEAVLYQKPVYVFSYKFPYVALIERDNRSLIVLLNVKTKEIKKYNVNGENNFISLSLDPTKTIIFALGSFNTTDRTSQLYLINVLDRSSTILSRVHDTQIEGINAHEVLLFNSGEGQDSSDLGLYDTNSKNFIYTTNQINEYLLSNDWTQILTRSGSTTATLNVSTFDKKQFEINQNDLVAWKDSNNLLVLRNTFPGVELSILNIQKTNTSLSFTPIIEMKNVAVSKIIAVFNNQLVVADNRYNFYLIDITKLPQP